MAEYIDREALLKDIEESVVFTVRSGKPSLEIRGANAITDRIKSAPTADVEEVKHGHWIEQTISGEQTWCCSECKTLGGPHWKRCPVCEAKMNGGKENEIE